MLEYQTLLKKGLDWNVVNKDKNTNWVYFFPSCVCAYTYDFYESEVCVCVCVCVYFSARDGDGRYK